MLNITPLLTIAIPTHNRAKYAIPTIHSLLAIADERIEIIVSDTSTDGELAAYIEGEGASILQDSRLKYLRSYARLDMTDNHNTALAAATGEYVCLIGDDDTITADALRAVAWASERGVELIAPNVVANYAWPDFRSRYFGAKHASRMYIVKNFGEVAIRRSSQAIDDALCNAAQGTEGLPKIYHGIVKRTLLERVRERSGAYFHGSSPDVSGAIGLALCSDSFMVIDYPLTIPGASGGSNTGRSAMNTHKGKLGQEAQTKSFEDKGWSLGVPRFFSVETVWAHAALETISRIAPARVSQFNFARLMAVCRVLHPEYADMINHASLEATQLLNVTLSALDVQIRAEIRRFRY